LSNNTVTDTNLNRLLDRNRAFAATDVRTEVPVLPFLPRQGLYLITCLDCRVDPAQVLGVGMGDALVQRNIGGRVTPSVLGDIAYAAYLVGAKAPEGPWFEVAIIHHTGCGSALLADDSIRRGYAERMGLDERALLDTAVLDPAHTVAVDVERARQYPQIPEEVKVSGHVYDLESGLVTTVVPAG
jgi:carbonic anhydrase